jgi:hypothetical protein
MRYARARSEARAVGERKRILAAQPSEVERTSAKR